MKQRVLGRNGKAVSEIGLGCMGMSGLYGQADRAESIATIHAALDRGVTLLDTGDFYGDGHNELLIREALQGIQRENVFISLKFDGNRHPRGEAPAPTDHPPTLKALLTDSLRRLGTDYVDLYQPARVDPNVPIEETIGEMADLVRAGYIRYLGLSEVGQEVVRRAHAVHPIHWLQIEYSLFNRGIEADILPTLRTLGISVSAYGVLARGLLSGNWSQQRDFAPDDKRQNGPRFKGENLEHNLVLVEALREIAIEKRTTVAQIAIAWVLARGEDIVPLVGARRVSQLEESLGAAEVELGPQDLSRIETAIPAEQVAGEYYPVPRAKWFIENPIDHR